MPTKIYGHRLVKPVMIIALILMLAALASPAGASFVPSNGHAASLVLGQPNFASNDSLTTARGMNWAQGVAIDPNTHMVFVADQYNNRVLRFASLYALTNGAAAKVVLGQPNFTSSAANTTRNGMYYPSSVFVDSGGRLWVADFYNNRVLRFDHASTITSGASANGVLGQPDFIHNTAHASQSGMYNPSGVFVDASSRLWVADTDNHRLLRFNNAAAKKNGANADGVLGQPGFTSKTAHTTRSGMNFPEDVAVDASGRLWVADGGNNRVLRFNNAASKPNGANADSVLGQPKFTSKPAHTTKSGMHFPDGVAVDMSTGWLYVSDFFNNRILVFNSAAALANGASASYVLGQKNFTTGTHNTGGISAASLYGPGNIFYDQIAKVLLIADSFNSRVLMYGKP